MWKCVWSVFSFLSLCAYLSLSIGCVWCHCVYQVCDVRECSHFFLHSIDSNCPWNSTVHQPTRYHSPAHWLKQFETPLIMMVMRTTTQNMRACACMWSAVAQITHIWLDYCYVRQANCIASIEKKTHSDNNGIWYLNDRFQSAFLVSTTAEAAHCKRFCCFCYSNY